MSTNVKSADFGTRSTPEQKLLKALEYADDIKSVIIVTRTIGDADDDVHTLWSNEDYLTLVGMLDMAKDGIKAMSKRRDDIDDE